MKILHIHTKMVSGGIEAIICGLANEMAKSQDVTVCTIFKPTESDVFYERLSPAVKKLNCGKEKFGFSIKEIFKVYQLIRKHKYEVVHIHGCFQYYFLSVLLLHRKVKFFYTIHSDAAMENLNTTSIFIGFKTFCFRKGWMKAITISSESKKSFTNLYHCDSQLISNGVPMTTPNASNPTVDQYRFSPLTKVFVHPGRISEAKNQVVLCQAFANLLKQNKDVVLLIAGMPEDKQILAEMKPYFNNRIVYLGERKDVIDLLAKADAFCLPSIWEGLPVSLLEALSVGCVPICSPVGGIVNVIQNGENGLLSKSSSLEDYTEALNRYLAYSEKDMDALKKRVKVSFEPYNIKNTAKKYIEFYK